MTTALYLLAALAFIALIVVYACLRISSQVSREEERRGYDETLEREKRRLEMAVFGGGDDAA